MIPLRVRLILAALAFALPGFLQAGECLIVCGGPEVFIIPADADRVADKDRLWRWRAADSLEIPAEMHAQFRTTDECKPAGEAIPGVKSIDQHPQTGKIVYHQGTEKTWWSDTVRFLQPARTLTLPAERLYKVRWDVDRGGQ